MGCGASCSSNHVEIEGCVNISPLIWKEFKKVSIQDVSDVLVENGYKLKYEAESTNHPIAYGSLVLQWTPTVCRFKTFISGPSEVILSSDIKRNEFGFFGHCKNIEQENVGVEVVIFDKLVQGDYHVIALMEKQPSQYKQEELQSVWNTTVSLFDFSKKDCPVDNEEHFILMDDRNAKFGDWNDGNLIWNIGIVQIDGEGSMKWTSTFNKLISSVPTGFDDLILSSFRVEELVTVQETKDKGSDGSNDARDMRVNEEMMVEDVDQSIHEYQARSIELSEISKGFKDDDLIQEIEKSGFTPSWKSQNSKGEKAYMIIIFRLECPLDIIMTTPSGKQLSKECRELTTCFLNFSEEEVPVEVIVFDQEPEEGEYNLIAKFPKELSKYNDKEIEALQATEVTLLNLNSENQMDKADKLQMKTSGDLQESWIDENKYWNIAKIRISNGEGHFEEKINTLQSSV